MDIQSNAVIVVVGAGAMGAGIAQVAAMAGHPVIDRGAETGDPLYRPAPFPLAAATSTTQEMDHV